MIIRPSCVICTLALSACAAASPAPNAEQANPGGAVVATTADPVVAPFIVAAAGTDTTMRLGIALRVTAVMTADTTRNTLPVVMQSLPPERAAALLEQLAGRAPDPPQRSAFRFSTSSLPAPRPGATTRIPFADGGALRPAVEAAGPLRIVHTSPRGAVATTSQIGITFSQPMVSLSSPPPAPEGVRLTPAVKGSWRWLDVATLVFEADGALPGATRYTVSVPAGLRSAAGAALGAPLEWTFATSTPQVADVSAIEIGDPSEPLIGIVFDQRIDADAIVPLLRLQVDGAEVPLRIATEEERARATSSSYAVRTAPGRALIVRTARPMRVQGNARAPMLARLEVSPGVPSLEGPERSQQPMVHEFEIRRGLSVVEHGCGRSDACAPGTPWTIRFNYPLRPVVDTASWVRVEPALPGATIQVWNDHIVVLGSPRAHTTYTVHLDSTIATAYGDNRLGAVPPLRFAVGAPQPQLWLPGGATAVLPRTESVLPILTQNTDAVSVEIRAVTPSDWPAYAAYLSALRYHLHAPALPGRVLSRSVVRVAALAAIGEARVELESALREAGGHVIVTAAAPGDTAPRVATWVQQHDIILDIAEDGAALTVRAADRAGTPLPNVELQLNSVPAGRDTLPLATARTDERGMATLEAPYTRRTGEWVLTARTDARTALLPSRPLAEAIHALRDWTPTLRQHFVTDRPIYAPGDTVRFAGWLRVASLPGNEPVTPSSGQRLVFTAADPRSAEIGEDTIAVRANGRVEGSFVLPLEANAGVGSVRLRLLHPSGALYSWFSYQVEEVRRPNFNASLTLDPGPHIPGTRVAATLSARYYTGGGVPGAEVHWVVRSSPARYEPPGNDDYDFGVVRYPSGRWYEPHAHATRTDAAGSQHLSIAIDSLKPHIAMHLTAHVSVTDVDRQSRDAIRTVVVHPATVYVGLRTATRFVRQGEPLMVDALVVDLEGRAVAARPVELRALRQQRRVEKGVLIVDEVQRGACTLQSHTEPVRCTLRALPPGDYIIAATVTDEAGRQSISELAVRVAGESIPASARGARDSVAVHTQRDEYEPGDTVRILIESSLRDGHAVASLRRAGVLESHTTKLADGIATLALPVRDAHVPNINVHVSVVAADGRMASAETRYTVAPATRRLTVTVQPAAAVVQPGDTTSITVHVRDREGRPVPNADVVLSGVDEALHALSHIPPRHPLESIYSASGPGVIDHTLRTHAVDGTVAEGNVITGVAIDAITGRPLQGVWVETSDGRGAWTGVEGRYRIAGVEPGSHVVHARAESYVSAPVENVVLARGGVARVHFAMLTPWAVMMGRAEAAAGGMIGRDALSLNAMVVTSSEVAASPAALPAPALGVLRSVFTPVAAFVTEARTRGDGTVTIPVTLPHSLTRYRVRAVASQGDRRFGAGEASLTARRPLMVRVMPPRFLHRGDRFELTVLLENRSDVTHDVEVAVRAVNAQTEGSTGRRARVHADDRVELRFPMIAGTAGSAIFQVVASGGSADAAQVEVPVLLPAVTETFAVYGQLDDARAVSYPLQLPSGSIPDHTRVDIGFSTTAAHGLRDAITFLIDCFFDLPEVAASRIIALSAIRDLPAATPWSRAAIDAAIRTDITRLARAQLYDGGWSIFPARFDADPFITVHAASALARAHALGHDVPERTLTSAGQLLARMDEHAPRADDARSTARSAFAPDYPLQARHAVQAYALHVRRRLGHDVSASAAGLLSAAGASSLTAEALAWLLPLLSADTGYASEAAEIRRELDARIVRSAGTAGIVSPYNAGGRNVLYSPRRSDAVVLAALVADRASDELVASLARGLMAHRVRGRWANTQENAYAVAALADYLARSEATTPALVARAWTGPRLAAQHEFRGRSDDRIELTVPADSIADPGSTASVTLAREGAGRVYYRVALQHALAGLTPPLARGFDVSRTYEAVDDPADVRRDTDGTWRIRLGARVRVRIAVGNPGPRYHVAIVDALPAAFEATNPALAGTGSARQPAPRTASMERIPLYPEHVNVRADRYEAFRSRLDAGRHELTYLAVATTPGHFAAPAPRAEEMYAPETFGRGAAERVIVEAPAR